MISQPLATSTIRLARVTHVHPEGQKMEVIFLDTGDYGRDVQVMSPYAGTDFGFTGGIPAPEEEGHDVNLKDNDPGKRHINAVIASCNGIHICLGYLFPQVTQMAFTKDGDKNRLIERHTSDFVRTIDDKGNMDLAHPSGAFITISEKGEPAELGGKDFDKVFKLKHNLKSFPQVALRSIMPAGSSKTTSAEIVLSSTGDCSVHAHRDVAVDAQTRDMILKSGLDTTLTVGRDLIADVEASVDFEAKANIMMNTYADFEVNAVDARIKASKTATVRGTDVVLRGLVQVTSNTPLTYVKGDLIVAGGLSLGGEPYDPDLEQAPAAGEGGESVISGGELLTIRASNIVIEGAQTVTIKGASIVLESDDIVLDGPVQVNGDVHVDGIVYDSSVGPGD